MDKRGEWLKKMSVAAIIVDNAPFGGDNILKDTVCLGELAEARFVSPKRDVAAIAQEYERCVEALLIFAKKEDLEEASAALEKVYPEFVQCGEGGCGVFSRELFDVYLLPYEEEKRGDFIRNICLPRMMRRGQIAQKIVFRGVFENVEKVREAIEKCRVADGRERLKFSVFERYDDVKIEVRYEEDTPKTLIDSVTKRFADEFANELYAMDDTPLEKRLCELLKVRGKKVSVAESFTGGGVGRRIVSVSGASEVYFEGLNTYNEDAKIKRLNVSPYTLKTVGAVSDQTAYEMCAGLLATRDCQAAIATTGIAGPKSDSSNQPVGLCYLAIGTEGKIYIARHIFGGSRETITEKAVNHALFWAYKHLK